MLHQVTSRDGTVLALEQVTDGPTPLLRITGATAARAPALVGEVLLRHLAVPGG